MKKLFPGTKLLRHTALLVASLAAVLFPVAAHARTYEVLTVDVPFKFNIASRTFEPGQYQFVVAGPGLLALRDSNGHFIAAIVTRSVDTGTPATTSKLVFDTHKKHSKLLRIVIENRSQAMEIMGEQFALRSTPFPATIVSPDAIVPVGVERLFERGTAPGFKQ